jgi:hypothetical protein
MDVRTGDTIEIPSNKVDQPPRRGVIERVVRPDPLTIEVRWDDAHTSIIQPSGGTLRVLQRGS